MISSSKIETRDLSPQILDGVAQEESVNSLINTINGLVNTVNTLKSTVDTLASSPSGGGVKKVQRGSTIAAGTITIEEVDMNKAVVYSVSKGSAGTVAARGTLAISETTVSGKHSSSYNYNQGTQDRIQQSGSFSGTIAAHTGTLSGGTTDLTTKGYSAVLTSSTTLTCDGPVEWQVVEYL